MQYSINQNLCTGCGNCLENCPRGAIFLVDGGARIDENLCSGCGVCVTACPRGAILEERALVQPRPQVTPKTATAPVESRFKKTVIALGSTLVSFAAARLLSNLEKNESRNPDRSVRPGQSGSGNGGQRRRRRGRK